MKFPLKENGLVWTAQSIILLSIPDKMSKRNFLSNFSLHVETAQMEQIFPTREAQVRQLMNCYSLHSTNCRDMKLPVDKNGLVWIAQSIMLLPIPGMLLQANLHRKFSLHVETARMIPNKGSPGQDMKLPVDESGLVDGIEYRSAVHTRRVVAG